MPPASASAGASRTATTSTSGPGPAAGCDRVAPDRAGRTTNAAIERRKTRFRTDMVDGKTTPLDCSSRADVAELVDAHGSGPCRGNPVESPPRVGLRPQLAEEVARCRSHRGLRSGKARLRPPADPEV